MTWNFLIENFGAMDTTKDMHPRNQPTAPGDPSKSGPAEMDRDQLAYYNSLRDEHILSKPNPELRGARSRVRSESESYKDLLEEDSETRIRLNDFHMNKSPHSVHPMHRKVDFDAPDQAYASRSYQSPKVVEIERGPQLPPPRPPTHSSYRPTVLQDSHPYHWTPPLAGLSPPPPPPPTAKDRRRRFQNEGHARFVSYEDDRGLRHPRVAENYRRNTYFDGLSAPDDYASATEVRYNVPSHEPWSTENDPYRQRKFGDTYDTETSISGYPSKELQKRDRDEGPVLIIPEDQNRNGKQIGMIRRYHDEQNQSKFPLVKAAYSSLRPTAIPAVKARFSRDPYFHEQDVSLYDTDSSSSDNEAWTDTGEVGFQYNESVRVDAPLNQTDTPPAIKLHSNTKTDEDLLNPSDWGQKMSVMECAIKESHKNRASWPAMWRHSDNKTSPKALGKVWPQIIDVDRCVSQLGLDAAVPIIDDSKWQLKRRGTLAEVVAAYKARLAKGEKDSISYSEPSSSSITGTASWDSTCEQVQRLLKARDYMICVCRDAEYLNDLHPTMDAITWFEQAQDVNGAARSEVVELMSVKISQLSEIIRSLNLILRAIMWGWSERSTICIQSDQEMASSEQDDLDRLASMQKLENTRSRTKASHMYANGERRIQICIQTLELGLKIVLDEVEVFAAILSQALFYQCDVLISDDNSHYQMVNYGREQIPGLFFNPRGLRCMGEVIQDRNVWVLEQFPNEVDGYPYVTPPIIDPNMRLSRSLCYVRTTIVDLARIWGPIWQASELSERDLWHWYRLPGGYIGAPAQQRLEVALEMDEAPCHFSSTPEGTFGKCPSSQFFVPNLPYLLIGHGLPTALLHRKSCPTNFETGLGGMALQTIGTLKPFRYVDATAFNIAVGHGGAQASWNTQIKLNPGILMKQSLLDRWKLEPKFRNPRLLLLWYGLEVSCCTRNARRCRLVDVIRSRSMIEYLSAIYRPESGLTDYKTSLFEALSSTNATAFVELYDNHPEWQGELGTVVARCLELLKESGVDKKGDLAAFAFMEKFHDPEQLAILPRKDHTWIPMLKDSFDSATFAFMSHQCLGYPRNIGQKCRLKDRAEQGSKSVLQTSFTSTKRSDMTGLFKRMEVNHRLTMHDLSRFRIKRRSSKGILLGTWRGALWQYLHIPSTSAERFREKRQDGERAVRVFVASSRRCRLARLREPPAVMLVIDEDDVVSGDIDPNKNVNLGEPLSQRDQTARNHPPGDPPRATRDHVPQRNSGTSTIDNASTLRGDDAGSARPKSEASASKETLSVQELDQLRIDASTQTERTIAYPILTTTPSPTQNGEFLLPLPRSPGSDAGGSSTHLSHSRSGSHGESSGRSSGHGHRHRRSHGDREARERILKDESLASKLGFR